MNGCIYRTEENKCKQFSVGGVLSFCYLDGTCDCRIPSNADRIRSMTDEELATWLNCMQSNAYHCGEFGRTNAAYPYDNKAWLDWLKSPVAEVQDGT